MNCACGVPNKANFYVHVVIGKDVPGGTETDYSDIYVCDVHGKARMTNAEIRELFRFDDAAAWKILEKKITRLR